MDIPYIAHKEQASSKNNQIKSVRVSLSLLILQMQLAPKGQRKSPWCS
jgi:hypothetical protein